VKSKLNGRVQVDNNLRGAMGRDWLT